MSNPFSGKIALITGTSSGTGLSAAVQLAQRGFTVVATMRDTTKAGPLEAEARAAGVSVEVRALDVQDDASVTTCVEEVLKTYGHIDLLVNNAGAGFLGTLEQTSLPALRNTMETNFFGVWRVTQAVFPAMRAAHSGRIISVTSVGGVIGQPFNDAYCAAKFAVEGFMESLTPVAQHFGVEVAIVEPGPVNTSFVSSVRANLPELTPELQELYNPLLLSYVGETEQRFATLGQTPAEAAQVVVEAATVEKPHLRYPTSPLAQNIAEQKFADPTGDKLVAFFRSRLGQ